jgi:hypothetical protein
LTKVLGALLFLFIACPAFGAGKVDGWCQDGNSTVTIQGQNGNSVNKYQRSFPSCTVTVYLTGTTTLAQIFADDNGTSKPNPFSAAPSGQWFFYAASGRYDVKFSGGGIPNPFTIGDLFAFDTLHGSASLTFNSGSNFTSGACYGNSGLTVTNAAVGDGIAPGWPSAYTTVFGQGLIPFMHVSATSTVTVELCNFSGSTLTNPGAATFSAWVFH